MFINDVHLIKVDKGTKQESLGKSRSIAAHLQGIDCSQLQFGLFGHKRLQNGLVFGKQLLFNLWSPILFDNVIENDLKWQKLEKKIVKLTWFYTILFMNGAIWRIFQVIAIRKKSSNWHGCTLFYLWIQRFDEFFKWKCY